jgi:hypothetical protein
MHLALSCELYRARTELVRARRGIIINVVRAARRGFVPECAVVVGRKLHYGTEPPIYRRFLLTEGSVVISERGPMKPREATTHAIEK